MDRIPFRQQPQHTVSKHNLLPARFQCIHSTLCIPHRVFRFRIYYMLVHGLKSICLVYANSAVSFQTWSSTINQGRKIEVTKIKLLIYFEGFWLLAITKTGESEISLEL